MHPGEGTVLSRTPLTLSFQDGFCLCRRSKRWFDETNNRKVGDVKASSNDSFNCFVHISNGLVSCITNRKCGDHTRDKGYCCGNNDRA